MEATSGRCHRSLVSSLAYSGCAPAGQEAVLFDQRYVRVREEGCELVIIIDASQGKINNTGKEPSKIYHKG